MIYNTDDLWNCDSFRLKRTVWDVALRGTGTILEKSVCISAYEGLVPINRMKAELW
jgi:hypothetical protein